jgi:hypothetical protein
MVPMEISDIRRRFRMALEQAKKASAERHTRADAASVAYGAFLRDVAIPVVRMFSNIAKAEGQAFGIFTPADGVRLVSERHADDFIEIFLDNSADPPEVTIRVNRRRGGDVMTSERPLKAGAAIDSLTDEDVLALLLSEIGNLTER